jgi:hypothetical protein
MRTVGIVAANVVACCFAIVLIALSPSSDGRYAVMAWPGSVPGAAIEIVTRAGGNLVALGGVDLIVVAQSDDQEFRMRLAAAGAFVIFNPILAIGCKAQA